MVKIQDSSVVNFYLEKYGFLPPQITTSPVSELGIIVVIPCFNEPDLIRTLSSLNDCESPSCGVEVIVVVNSGEQESEDVLVQNEKTVAAFNDWNQQERSFTFHLIQQPNLPRKHAGVGLARKIGMDEAVARFDSLQRDGIIACFDADSSCDTNYLIEIDRHFRVHTGTPGCSIYFEHPIQGDEFDSKIYDGISHYELHLRYYNQCLRYCGLPYAFHTVGSSMAVRSSAYQKQGGMNKRKAGEDFYFIHKILALGNFTELNTTRVIPSPRVSDRVPFGTGKAIGDWMQSEEVSYRSYSFKTFQEIRQFVEQIPTFYEGNIDLTSLPVSDDFKVWLDQNDFVKRVGNVRSNAANLASFVKRFFVWFDAFTVLKLVHFLRDQAYPDQNLQAVCQQLLSELSINRTDTLLCVFRRLDRA